MFKRRQKLHKQHIPQPPESPAPVDPEDSEQVLVVEPNVANDTYEMSIHQARNQQSGSGYGENGSIDGRSNMSRGRSNRSISYHDQNIDVDDPVMMNRYDDDDQSSYNHNDDINMVDLHLDHPDEELPVVAETPEGKKKRRGWFGRGGKNKEDNDDDQMMQNTPQTARNTSYDEVDDADDQDESSYNKMQNYQNEREDKRRSSCLTIRCLIISILFLIAMIVGGYYLIKWARFSSKDSSSMSPDDRDLYAIFQEVSGPDVLDPKENSTPQEKAANWVMFDDALKLRLKNASNSLIGEDDTSGEGGDAETVDIETGSDGQVENGSSGTYVNRKRIIQRYALAVMFYSLEGETWCDDCYLQAGVETRRRLDDKEEIVDEFVWNYLTDVHECDWEGIKCSDDNVIQAISIIRRDAKGYIPKEIAQLVSLKRLVLSTNSIGGTIPSELSTLADLRSIDLTLNNIRGTIPSGLFSLGKLKILRVAENQLTGSLPATIADAELLEEIDMKDNSLGGSIPAGIGSLEQLGILSLANNRFTSLPASFYNAKSLTYLDLAHNELDGNLPNHAADEDGIDIQPLLPESLKEIYLDHNRLDGRIPGVVFGDLENLKVLTLNNNNFEGRIPPTFGDLEVLDKLILYRNNFRGVVSDNICDLKMSELETDCATMIYNKDYMVECDCCTKCH